MTTSHTPGPWHVIDGTHVSAKHLGDGIWIPICHSFNPLEGEANAHLIAAAPELLELCHALFHTLCDLTHIGDTPTEELDEGEQEFVESYYAITRKARGKVDTDRSASDYAA